MSAPGGASPVTRLHGSAVVGAAAIRLLQQESGLPIRVAQEFSETLLFPDMSFDVVFAHVVLHHASDLKAIVESCDVCRSPAEC